MIGILLMSHGKMAEGMLDSCKLFFGEVEKMETLSLVFGDDPAEFGKKITEAASKLDDGSGVIAFCDMFGGTPSNQSMYVLNDRLQVITGMNLTMVLELLGQRMSCENIDELDLNALMETGRTGIRSLNEIVASMKK